LVYFRRAVVRRYQLRLHGLDRLLQQPRVQVEADRRDMAALLGPQQISSAANLQIAHGDSEASAKLGGLLNRLQALLGLGRHAVIAFVEQVGVGALRAAADSPTQLVELRQELRDRFGEPPEPALNLMTWLQIKSQALAAGVNSIVTTPEEFIVRLPEGSPMDREKLRRRFGRDPSVRVGPQFVRLDRRALGDSSWLDALTGVLETLAK
jgi:hypothetical protein